RLDRHDLFAEGFHRLDCGFRGLQRRDARNAKLYGGAPDAAFVGAGALAAGSIEDELDLPVVHVVEQVRPPFRKLANARDLDAGSFQPLAGPLGGNNILTEGPQNTTD